MASDTTFFSTVAQIIPVLWLAMVIDKFGQAKNLKETTRAALIGLSVMTAVAETFSVLALTTSLANPLVAKIFVGLIAGALAWGLMTTIVAPLLFEIESRLVKWTWVISAGLTVVLIIAVLAPPN